MVVLTLVFLVMLAAAVLCAVLLARAGAPAPVPVSDVESMKTALERRMREGAEFRF